MLDLREVHRPWRQDEMEANQMTSNNERRRSELALKQEAFCREYVVDFNATRAAIRAGYSPKSARSTGHRLLTKDDISAEVAWLANERLERPILRIEDSHRALKKIIEDETCTPEQRISAVKTFLDHHAKTVAVLHKRGRQM